MGNGDHERHENNVPEERSELLGNWSYPEIVAGRLHVELGSFEVNRIDGVVSKPRFSTIVHLLISWSFFVVPFGAKIGGGSLEFIVISLFVAAFLALRTGKSEPFEVSLLIGGKYVKAASFASWDGKEMNGVRAELYKSLIELELERSRPASGIPE